MDRYPSCSSFLKAFNCSQFIWQMKSNLFSWWECILINCFRPSHRHKYDLRKAKQSLHNCRYPTLSRCHVSTVMNCTDRTRDIACTLNRFYPLIPLSFLFWGLWNHWYKSRLWIAKKFSKMESMLQQVRSIWQQESLRESTNHFLAVRIVHCYTSSLLWTVIFVFFLLITNAFMYVNLNISLSLLSLEFNFISHRTYICYIECKDTLGFIINTSDCIFWRPYCHRKTRYCFANL